MPVDPLRELEQGLRRDFTDLEPKVAVPDLPRDIRLWLKNVRPIVDGKQQDFRSGPMWLPIYDDNHPDIMIVSGRQLWKSTYCTNLLAYMATTRPQVEVGYVNHDETSLSAFANQRLRQGTFGDNELLALFPSHTIGSVQAVPLKNKSIIYNMTDHSEYKHVEGKSLAMCVLDEAQYQDIQFLSKLEKTFAYTHGLLRILGIGGEAGSPYERRWNQTDQKHWFYDNANWRDKLQFNSEGLIIDDYMLDALRGHWEATIPQHTEYRGYWIPQTIMPFIPLTIEDAKTKYKVPVKFSVEHQRLHEPQSIFTTHVMGQFNKALRRPLTHEMVEACMTPYSKLNMLQPWDVRALKQEYAEKCIVTMGIDWGSGPSASLTVSCILIKWDLGEERPPIYQIADIEPRPREDQRNQARYMIKRFLDYDCDYGVADLGYGVEKVKTMQEGGADMETAERFAGLGTDRFMGCTTMASQTMPFQFHQEKEDAHGSQVPQIKIDKTAVIQEFIDTVDRKVSHPDWINGEESYRPQLVIPFADQLKVLTEPMNLVNDFTSITRKDLARTEDIEITDPRQHPKKEFNHPPDSVMAIIYAIQASEHYGSSKWVWVSA